MLNSEKGIELFIEESEEMLDNIETMLVELEADKQNMDLVNNVFRNLHTIKGSAGMFGFSKISAFTHEFENLFDLIRQGELPVNREIIDLTLKARDHIRSLISLLRDEGTEPQPDGELRKQIAHYLGNEKPEGGYEKNESPEHSSNITYRITFAPSRDVFSKGSRPSLLLEELARLGEIITAAQTGEVPELDQISPEECYTKWTVILTTSAGMNAIKDVFIFVEDYCDVTIDIIDDEERIDTGEDYKRIGEILLDRGNISVDELDRLLEGKQKLGGIAVEEGLISEEELNSALEEQNVVRENRKKRTTASSTIRVRNEKLDELVNLVGELVTAQTRLSQKVDKIGDAELVNIGENLEMLTVRMRESAMNIRLVPLTELFNGYYRLVRDLSTELKKPVDLKITGAETELDKNVIEMLQDPLVHLIRNSIDHGIEEPAVRRELGKPEKGTLKISAEYNGASVIIKVADDGRGLVKENIRKKGVERGLVGDHEQLTDEEIHSLIFAPGFSTSQEATAISGRGVGLDVVKRNLESISATVLVESEEGNGTTFVLSIPLTLAIIDCLLIRLGDERYVINLQSVDECFIHREKILKPDEITRVASLHEEPVPYINLRNLLDIPGEPPEIQNAVVTLVEGKRMVYIVDEILGQYQTVIKSMDSGFSAVDEFSGSTILGDGTVALILDVIKIGKNLEKTVEV
jgi:two-component system, chemotaxis family, sensor kinase CheA